MDTGLVVRLEVLVVEARRLHSWRYQGMSPGSRRSSTMASTRALISVIFSSSLSS